MELATAAGLNAAVFGKHGGKNLVSKGWKFATRVLQLARWCSGKKIDLVLSHNSQEPLVVARLLGIRSVDLMDYEHHPGNHLSFRTAKRVIVPKCFPESALKKFGASDKKVRRYDGIKEDVYLADFEPDSNFAKELSALGVQGEDILIVVRPHAAEALYHRGIANRVFSKALTMLTRANCKVVLLPRKANDIDLLRAQNTDAKFIIPKAPLSGANLIAAADLVISGGGTMNREAAALGTPAATIFAGPRAAVDNYLINEGRMVAIESVEDLARLSIAKKPPREPRNQNDVRKQVVDMILD
jgi:predicted glycosyltransferase